MKNQHIYLVIVVLLLVSLSGYLLWQLKQFPPSSARILNPTPTISTTGLTISKKIGNSIIYSSSVPYTFPGSGLVEKKDKGMYYGYIVGTYTDIELIPNSNDIYIVLTDPLTKRTYKIRTLWKSKKESTTVYLRENINKIKATKTENGYLKKLGLWSEFISKMKKDTLLIAMLDTVKENNVRVRPALDKNFNYVTTWLIQR